MGDSTTNVRNARPAMALATLAPLFFANCGLDERPFDAPADASTADASRPDVAVRQDATDGASRDALAEKPREDAHGDAAASVPDAADQGCAASCPNGCCNGATCVPYASETGISCGIGGAACTSCPWGTGCDTSNGTCGEPNVVFVSSATYDGANFGGISGADAECQTMANNAGFLGTFIAYLSTSSKSASARLQGARGWVRTDGLPVADTLKQLAAGDLYYPVSLDEHGSPVHDDFQVITGTADDGTTKAGETCRDWTSSSNADTGNGGDLYAGYLGWQSWLAMGCGTDNPGKRIYCTQATHAVSVIPKAQGRKAFVTSVGWVPSGGIAGADAKCQSDAQQAGLSGTYLALLSTSTASAASRFPLTGPWVRPDGVTVFAQPSDLNLLTMMAPICVTADGRQHVGYSLVWNGSSRPDMAGTTSTTCNDWTSNAPGGTLTPVSFVGFTRGEVGDAMWNTFTADCDFTSSAIYCLQK